MSYTDFNPHQIAKRRIDVRKYRALVETRKTFNFIALCFTSLIFFFMIMAAFVSSSMGIVVMSIISIPFIYGFFWLYMLPSFIAFRRETEIATSLTFLNVLAGWTVIGWVVLLIWAYSARSELDVIYAKNI